MCLKLCTDNVFGYYSIDFIEINQYESYIFTKKQKR
jgi:hypothetical protein